MDHRPRLLGGLLLPGRKVEDMFKGGPAGRGGCLEDRAGDVYTNGCANFCFLYGMYTYIAQAYGHVYIVYCIYTHLYVRTHKYLAMFMGMWRIGVKSRCSSSFMDVTYICAYAAHIIYNIPYT